MLSKWWFLKSWCWGKDFCESNHSIFFLWLVSRVNNKVKQSTPKYSFLTDLAGSYVEIFWCLQIQRAVLYAAPNPLPHAATSCQSFINSVFNLQFQSSQKISLQTWATWRNVSVSFSASLAGLLKILSFTVTFSCGCRDWWGSRHGYIWSNTQDDFGNNFWKCFYFTPCPIGSGFFGGVCPTWGTESLNRSVELIPFSDKV